MSKLSIKWQGFIGKNHSWSICSQNICRELIKLGHDVDLFSTNGIEHFPNDLKSNLKGYIEEGQLVTNDNYHQLIASKLKSKYDCQLSYTAMINFEKYFMNGDKNRFAIWNYETTVLPPGFAKCYKHVDKMIPASEFSKKIFVDNGIPADRQAVIPHGIHLERFQNLGKYPLKTKKKIKILVNIAQPHLRKNIPGMFEAWGRAFTKKDDVCLVLKISKTGANNQFRVPFDEIFKEFRMKYKSHAEVEVIDTFIPDIEPLYNACDIIFTMTMAECFWMVGLEAMAADKVVIAPRYGGQLDYMNDDNSILIDGKVVRADNSLQYWGISPYASVFSPNIDQAATKLKEAAENYSDYHAKFSPKMKEMLPNYSWTNVARQFVNLCQ